jgi:hypothetical protein
MVIDTCYDRESNPQATIGELCIKPTNKNQWIGCVTSKREQLLTLQMLSQTMLMH